MMRFAGYAALFDRVDRGGDIIRRGAFAAAVPPLPIYWQHDPTRRIGDVESVSEDAHGLRVIGRVTASANRQLTTGSGLSFGYRVRAASDGTNRELTALDLIEVSVVTHPMQPLARVHAIEPHPPSTPPKGD